MPKALTIALICFAPPKRRGLYIAVVLTAAALFMVTASQDFRMRLMGMFSSTTDYNYTARDGRIEVWKRGMHYMTTHPVFGVGGGMFGVAEGMLSGKADLGFGVKYSAAHSAFVQAGAELGFGGLIALIVAFTGAVRGTFAARRASVLSREKYGIEPPDLALTASALCAMLGLITCAVMLSWAYMPMTWFSIACCVALAARARPMQALAQAAARRAATATASRRGLSVAPAARVHGTPSRSVR